MFEACPKGNFLRNIELWPINGVFLSGREGVFGIIWKVDDGPRLADAKISPNCRVHLGQWLCPSQNSENGRKKDSALDKGLDAFPTGNSLELRKLAKGLQHLPVNNHQNQLTARNRNLRPAV